jgi:hypothetical protein
MKRLLLGLAALAAVLLTHCLAFLASVGAHHLGLGGWLTAAIYIGVIGLAWLLALGTTEAQRFIAWAEGRTPKSYPKVRTPAPRKPQPRSPRFRRRFRN